MARAQPTARGSHSCRVCVCGGWGYIKPSREEGEHKHFSPAGQRCFTGKPQGSDAQFHFRLEA